VGKKCTHKRFWFENPRGRDYSEDLIVQRENITLYLREISWEVVDWIHPVQDRDQ
jgi:hypothetical protein